MQWKSKLIGIVLAVLLIVGCGAEQRPVYDTLPVSIPPGGTAIRYEQGASLTNVDVILSELNEEDRQVFLESLDWFGTESNVGFESIDGKTARQFVVIVNCLKEQAGGQTAECLE